MEHYIPKTAYEVRERDGNISWECISPNPLLEYTKELACPPEEATYGNALLMASFARSADFGPSHSGLEVWAHKHDKTIPFSEVAQKFECIGICTIGANTHLLFPTVFDLLAFLSKYSGAFVLAK